jgi:hypothetical protein
MSVDNHLAEKIAVGCLMMSVTWAQQRLSNACPFIIGIPSIDGS